MSQIPSPRTPTGFDRLAREARIGATRFIRTQADTAGRSIVPWLLLAILSTVELAGVAPSVALWTTPDPSVVAGIYRGTEFLVRHTPAILAGTTDPLRTWAEAMLPARSTWLVIAAVPVLLVTMLAVTRQHRRPTTNTRALRLAAVLLGRLVMVLYTVHLVSTVLIPIAIGAATVNLGVLALIVGGTAIVVRVGAGARPTYAPGPPQTRVRRAVRALAMLGIVVATAWTLQALPVPSLARAGIDAAGYLPAPPVMATPAR